VAKLCENDQKQAHFWFGSDLVVCPMPLLSNLSRFEFQNTSWFRENKNNQHSYQTPL
jgi:hypothetical protein